MNNRCTVYIDEAGDLGFQRGTKWFVLSAVVVNKEAEPEIRAALAKIKARLNVRNIHLREISDFNKRAFVVREINSHAFTYLNVIADTDKLERDKIDSPAVAYNYLCRMLLERVSRYLRDSKQIGNVVLSARGTKRDGELIDYIKEQLIPYSENQITPNVLQKIEAKPAGSWDMLQLADICATTTFLAYEINGWGFRVPCYLKVLTNHLYRHSGKLESYGIKYFAPQMKPGEDELRCDWACKEKERTPGATTTCHHAG